MDEELRGIQLDKPSKGKIKSKEQMEKHILDPSLENKPVERAIVLLTKGDEVQKLSVVATLPEMSDVDLQACYTKVIPKIQQLLPSSSTEFQVATSRMCRSMIERNLSVSFMIPSAMAGIENRDQNISSAWLETLLLAIPTFPIKVVNNEILPVAIQKSNLQNMPVTKIIGVRLLGKICSHNNIDSYSAKKEILPAILNLAQDSSYEVRSATAQQFPFISNGVGIDSVQAYLMPSLIELVQDDNLYVRAATAGIIVQMIPYLSPDVLKTTIVPLVIRLCDLSTRADDATSVIVAREMGRYCHSLASVFSSSDCTIIITIYKILAQRGLSVSSTASKDTFQDVTCRQHCAYNLPAMTMFVLNSSSSSLDLLYTVISTLSSDPCYLVRRIVASGLHEVAKCLGPQVRIIKDDVIRLLRDDSEDVLSCFVPHITITLVQFTKQNVLQVQQVDNVVIEIGRSLLKCEALIGKSNNWRLYTLFLRQLECLPAVFPSDFIHSQFLPIVFQKMVKGRAKPSRQQAGRTLLKFLRYNNKQQQRTDIRNRIINDLVKSNCCYTRVIYIRLCTELFEIFSTEYFKEFFFLPLLSLTEDRVANIRLCVLTLFPKLKSIIRLPNDRKLLTTLETVLAKMNQNEKDRDCRELLSNVIIQLNRMEVLTAKDKIDPEEQRLLDEENKAKAGVAIKSTGMPTNPVMNQPGTPRNQNYDQDSMLKSSSSNQSARVALSPRSPTLTTPSQPPMRR